jgi:hypothetical protein
MCYEVAITLSGGDETTLTKSFIISLEDGAANWYARLQLPSILSWHHLKEKTIVNFQDFHAELTTEENLLSCARYEKESLPNFCRRFLHLKPPAPEVSNDQVITQSIKALHRAITQSSNKGVQEHSKNYMTILKNLVSRRCYTFDSKSNRERFRKRVKHQDQLDTIEAGRRQTPLTTQLNMSKTSIMMVAGLQKIGRKNLIPRNLITDSEPLIPEKTFTTREKAIQGRDETEGEAQTNHCIACIMKMIHTIGQKIVPFS